jgi:hypothetical protein
MLLDFSSFFNTQFSTPAVFRLRVSGKRVQRQSSYSSIRYTIMIRKVAGAAAKAAKKPMKRSVVAINNRFFRCSLVGPRSAFPTHILPSIHVILTYEPGASRVAGSAVLEARKQL